VKILVGTSGFSYAEWKGSFYPKEVTPKKFLSYYATQFPTTEINNTFYRIPDAKTTAVWYSEVPENFTFTLKLSQKITHVKRLKEVDEEMERFLQAAKNLKEKLGTILVQLPPYFRRDSGLLEGFLSRYSGLARLAFEFRHESWFRNDTYTLLRRNNCALAIVESEDQEALRQITADFTYMRLRRPNYSALDLAGWAHWIQSQRVDVFCYLKHDEMAPVLARQLIDLLSVSG
jgi:uncharacterized protein YecE (DUF72 family)